MSAMRQSENFRYWKRPRHKWFVLATAILQLLCLWMNAREYQEIAKAGILSASEWARFAAQKILQCGFNSLTAAIFLGIFLIGALARSQRAARLAEGWLMLGLAAAWGAMGLALQRTSPGGYGIFWSLLLLLLLGGGVYTLWGKRSR